MLVAQFSSMLEKNSGGFGLWDYASYWSLASPKVPHNWMREYDCGLVSFVSFILLSPTIVSALDMNHRHGSKCPARKSCYHSEAPFLPI